MEPTITEATVGGKKVKTASIGITTSADGSNLVALTNIYTNEFVLYLQKKDTITQQPLKGAVFDLYGSYDEATNAKKTIKYYTDASNTTVGTLYYIGQTEPSDENGLAKVAGLQLSNVGKTYVYVLSEVTAPDGYVKPNYPGGIVPNSQVVTVTLDDVENNVFSTDMRNQTMGAPLYVRKTADGLDASALYDITVTITANEESVRVQNRTYEYYIYDGYTLVEGTWPLTATGSKPTGISNKDTCSFTVSLKAGQALMVKDVPVGYSYAVTESVSSGVHCSMTGDNGTGYFDNESNTMYGTMLEVPDAVVDEGGNVTNYAARMTNFVRVSNSNTSTAVGTASVTKVWDPADKAESSTTMKLFRVTDGNRGNVELIDSATLTKDSSSTDPVGSATRSLDGWNATWSNLPLYSADGKQSYDYYVAEELVPGYSMSTSRTTEELTVKGTGEKVIAVQVTNGSVTITNKVGGYELPQTGGSGTTPLAVGGVLLVSSALLITCVRRRVRGVRHGS